MVRWQVWRLAPLVAWSLVLILSSRVSVSMTDGSAPFESGEGQGPFSLMEEDGQAMARLLEQRGSSHLTGGFT